MQVREAYVSLVVLALMLGAHGIGSVSSWTILGGGRRPALLWEARLRVFGNVWVVSMGCYEPPGVFNPPTDRYRHIALMCNRSTNHIDGYEAGLLLAFARDYRERVQADKIIFIQAHDRSWHYRVPIWTTIHHLTQTQFFWTHDFGILPGHAHLTTTFKIRSDSEVFCTTVGYRSWPSLYKLIQFLFANTSLASVSFNDTVWTTPCCATFFLSPNRLSTRESHEYDQILNHLHWLTTHPDSPIWTNSRPTSSHTDNKLVAEVLERSWALIFTGQGRPQLQ
jgi:hypothetical protein